MGLLSTLGALFIEDDTAAHETEAKQQQEVERRTVLLIDDDVSFLEATGALLREAGFNVLKSSSGPKGLNILRYAPQDIKVVLLDFDMPHFDGAETLQFVRKLSPAARIIGVTGVDPKFLPPTFSTGVDELLPKSLAPTTLIAQLQGYFTPVLPALAGQN